MSIFFYLIANIGLALALIMSVILLDTVLITYLGGVRLKALNFGMLFPKTNNGTIFDPLWILPSTVMSFILVAASYFWSVIFCLLEGHLNLTSILTILACFSIFIFYHMECNEILHNIELSRDAMKYGWTYRTVWEEIDLSLTPAIITALLMLLGMIFAYYQFK
jgi:hypothetical protein